MRFNKWKTDRFKGNIELVTSPFELVELLKSRRDSVTSGMSELQYIARGRSPSDPKWSGFSTSEELITKLTEGVPMDETSGIADLRRTLAEISTDDVKKLREPILDVQGGVPVAPLVLLGIPTCMRSLRKMDVPSKILTVSVCVGDVCTISSERMREVNLGILSAIFSVEKAGYRVRLFVETDYYYPNGDSRIYAMQVKTEHQTFNLSRMMYPLSDTSFFRGVSFEWHVSDPDGRARGGLGFNPGYGNAERMAAWASVGVKGPINFFKTHEFVRSRKTTDEIRRECIISMLKV